MIEESIYLGMLNHFEWRSVIRNRARAKVLIIAGTLGWDAVVDFVKRLRMNDIRGGNLMDGPNWEELTEKMAELVEYFKAVPECDRPPVIILNYYGFRVDLTEQVYQE